MKKFKFTTEQIILALRQAEAGLGVDESQLFSLALGGNSNIPLFTYSLPTIRVNRQVINQTLAVLGTPIPLITLDGSIVGNLTFQAGGTVGMLASAALSGNFTQGVFVEGANLEHRIQHRPGRLHRPGRRRCVPGWLWGSSGNGTERHAKPRVALLANPAGSQFRFLNGHCHLGWLYGHHNHNNSIKHNINPIIRQLITIKRCEITVV